MDDEQIKECISRAGAHELGAKLYGGKYLGAIRFDFLKEFAEYILECDKKNRADEKTL